MKHTLLLLLLLICSFHFAKAQTCPKDVVYLKNGSIIKGTLIEITPDKGVKIETADHSIFVYPLNEVDKIVKETTESGKEEPKAPAKIFVKGYQAFIELGVIGNLGDADGNSSEGGMGKLNIINGYRFSNHLYAGLGVGVRISKLSPLIPIFADARYFILNKKTTPYISCDIGYSILAEGKYEFGGFMLAPEIGTSFKITPKSAFNIGLGFELQQIKVYSSEVVLMGASLNLGISF